jgi:cobalt-zinc-cadmium efflux system outer membrane protein
MGKLSPGWKLARCVALAAAVASPAFAAPEISFHEAVQAAWDRLPQRRNLDARRHVAEARFSAGGTLFPNAPYVTGNYFNDRIAGSNEGYITTQGEVGTPIWLPGEGTATQNAARADAATVAADEAADHLALASHMLDLVRRASLAANAADIARRHMALAGKLAAALHESVAVGETAQSDALAADAEAAQARITLSNAAADLSAAQASLQILTGSDAIPVLAAPPAPPVTPMLVAASAITPDVAQAIANHPAIMAAERALAAARAQARLVRIENRDDPEVGLQVINEKQFGSPWDTRVGVMVHFPFATAVAMRQSGPRRRRKSPRPTFIWSRPSATFWPASGRAPPSSPAPSRPIRPRLRPPARWTAGVARSITPGVWAKCR